MILVAYDGSTDSQAALEQSAQLMPGAQATMLTVWEPFIDMLTGSGAMSLGGGMGGSYGDSQKIDEDSEAAAIATAEEGAERARAAGLEASPQSAQRKGGVANTVLAAAQDADADVVVMGTRGRGGVESFLLGSVSHALVQHADRPVLVVPAPALAAKRREGLLHAVKV